METVTPAALRPGDCIAVVAPSGPVKEAAFWSGLAWLRQRYRILVRPAVLSRKGFLAGEDGRRAEELARAFRDERVKAIVAARGGYGATRILTELPWEALRARPKWLVGFSDITALHVAAWQHFLCSVHGANVTGLGVVADPRTRFSWLRALEHPFAPGGFRQLQVLRGGAPVRGPLVGGNLTVLGAMAAAGALRIPDGAVLALEDVGERPYRLDRTLTSLLASGLLSNVGAVVLGGFDQCDAGADGVGPADVLLERLTSLRVPLLAGAPFGHGSRNDAFTLGALALVSGDSVTWGRDAG